MKNVVSILFFMLMIGFITFLYATFSTEEKPVAVEESQTEIVIPTVTQQEPIVEEEKPKPIEEAPRKESKADKIIAIAKAKLNLPYKQAGTTDAGYDCSGLVMTSFRKEGVSLPRASYQMAKKGKKIQLKNAKEGDLVFFTTNERTPNKINHVGLVTFVEDGVVHFIHSTIKKGVVINNTDEEYYKKSFATIKRVLKDD